MYKTTEVDRKMRTRTVSGANSKTFEAFSNVENQLFGKYTSIL